MDELILKEMLQSYDLNEISNDKLFREELYSAAERHPRQSILSPYRTGQNNLTREIYVNLKLVGEKEEIEDFIYVPRYSNSPKKVYRGLLIVILKAYQNKTYAEIGRNLEINPNTCRTSYLREIELLFYDIMLFRLFGLKKNYTR